MGTISGNAKLTDGSPASQIIAVRKQDNIARTVYPDAVGNYSMASVRPGDWIVTALGPAGYRPESHLVNIPAVPEAASVYSKLVSWWEFENSLTDRMNRNLLSGPTNYIPGANTGSTGIDQTGLIRKTSPVGLASGLTKIAVGGWYRWNSNATGTLELIFGLTNGDGGGNSRFIVHGNDNGTLFEAGSYNASGQLIANVTYPTPATGIWRHFVVTMNGALMTAYINGVSVGSVNTAVPVSGFNQIILGFGFANAFVNTDRDDLFVCNDTLTAGEVAYLYQGGNTIKFDQLTFDAGV